VYKVGQVRPGRVTRVAQFGAFVELEPGVEALAHASTFEPTGRAEGWRGQVTAGMTANFKILAIDPRRDGSGWRWFWKPGGGPRGQREPSPTSFRARA
jgi:ribosomal protein S1